MNNANETPKHPEKLLSRDGDEVKKIDNEKQIVWCGPSYNLVGYYSDPTRIVIR